jgi:hypothetical protein
VRAWNPRLWLWTIPLLAVQLPLVLLLWYAAHPLVSWFMAPLLDRLAGPASLHYPRLFALMPGIFDRADAVLGALVGSIAFGAATPAFAAAFRGEAVSARAALARAFARAPQLVLVLLPFNLLLLGIDLFGRALGPMVAGRKIAVALPLLVTGSALAMQAAFFYAVALVMLEGYGARAALRALPSTWRPGFSAAWIVSAVTLFLLALARLPGVTPALLVERGVPELSGWLTVWHVATGLVNGFVLTGAATLLYLVAVAPERRAA